jgi:hypothetical protein
MPSGPATLLHTRLLGGATPIAQVWFDAAVLEKYREAGAQVLRTNTIGRLKTSQWTLDFGIADAGSTGEKALIHVSVGEAQARIPESERRHWASHAETLPVSVNYLTLQISHGACVDDGDLRAW